VTVTEFGNPLHVSNISVMNPSYFETLSSGQFQNKIVLSKTDALVKISRISRRPSMLYSFLDRIAQAYQGRLKFFEVDPIADQGLCSTYGVTNSTALLIFKKGTLVDKISEASHRTTVSTKIHTQFFS
jgi:thioredoxin-like negative regulator of GroEL